VVAESAPPRSQKTKKKPGLKRVKKGLQGEIYLEHTRPAIALAYADLLLLL